MHIRKVSKIVLYVSMTVFVITAAILLAVASDDNNAVKVRYALTSTFGTGYDLSQSPAASPVQFVHEDGPVPEELARAVKNLEIKAHDSALQKALMLAEHIVSGPGPGKGELDIDVVSTYKTVLSDEYGDCTDYARLFTGLSYAAGIDARIWTTSFNHFGNTGHVFSEFYSEEHGWVFLDPFNSFIVLDKDSQKPMSVIEFRDRLLEPGQHQNIVVKRISKERFGFSSDAEALEYYKRGASRFGLRMANDVLSYDELPWVKTFRSQSKSIEQGISILVGRYPRLLILETPENVGELGDIKQLKSQILMISVACFSSFVTLVVFGFAAVFRRSKSGHS